MQLKLTIFVDYMVRLEYFKYNLLNQVWHGMNAM